MKKSQLIPFCYACNRIEDKEGWKSAKKIENSQKIYETLCRACLVQLTENLLKDVENGHRGKVA